MRRPAATATALLATAALLAGCSSDDPAGPSASPSASASESAPAAEVNPEDLAALEKVTVEGEPGALPTLEFTTPFAVEGPVAVVETPGTGAELQDGQRLSIHYTVSSGDDGTTLGSTWEQKAPGSITLGDPGLIPVLNEVLAGQKVGVRLLFASPGTEAVVGEDGETAQPAAPSTVMAIDVVEAVDIPDRAEGEAVEPPAGLPEVTLAEDGEPSITVPSGAKKPTELVAQTLIKGDGPKVESGQTLTMHYTGWLWDGTEFDSSWAKGTPFETQIGAGQVIAGWDEGLVGQTVGSQVLLVIPPDKGYADKPQGAIPANSTLIFVVDILDAR